MTDLAHTSHTEKRHPNRHRRHVPGEPGLWVVIFSEMLIFGLYFCSIGYYWTHTPVMVTESQARLNQAVAAANTILLLTGSLFVALGVRDTRGPRADRARRYFLLGTACAAGFGALKIYEYAEKLSAGITPATNFFFQAYFAFTALHMLHVIIGAALLVVMAGYCRSPSTMRRRMGFIEGAACYWHLVDLLWVGLYAVLYLA